MNKVGYSVARHGPWEHYSGIVENFSGIGARVVSTYPIRGMEFFIGKGLLGGLVGLGFGSRVVIKIPPQDPGPELGVNDVTPLIPPPIVANEPQGYSVDGCLTPDRSYIKEWERLFSKDPISS